MTDTDSDPDLTVVVPSVNGWPDLEGCLAALSRQSGSVSIEILVVDRIGKDVPGKIRQHFPSVEILEVAPHTSIPEMRALAFRQARGRIVGVIEDHVLVPPDWAVKMLDAHRSGAVVVGGSVFNSACDRLTDWAAFLCEYSHCLVPPPAGPCEWVTGNNVTYRKELLDKYRPIIEEHRWEDHLHSALRRAGVELLSRPDIAVGHKKHYTIAEYAHQRYLYSRSFSGMRAGSMPVPKRLVFGFLSLGLSPLLFWRVVRNVLKSGRHYRQLVLSLPLLVFFALSWSLGDAVGFWCGRGRSLEKIC